MNHYNVRLSELREEKGLSLKEAAKGIGIARWRLYFYENGYFKPNKKALEKIEEFYKAKISLNGEAAYPIPTKEKTLTKEKEDLTYKRILFGVASAFTLLITITGTILFNQTLHNSDSLYGSVYTQTKASVIEQGDIGYDIVTSLKYHYATTQKTLEEAAVIFYEANNILNFNECTYSALLNENDLELGRCRLQFGSTLAVDSYECSFTYTSLSDNCFFTCRFKYDVNGVKKVYNLENVLNTDNLFSEQQIIEMINENIDNTEVLLSELISDCLGREVSFYRDFLSAREKGREMNFAMQAVSLMLIAAGILLFFGFFRHFLHLLLKNIKPRLAFIETEEKGGGKKEPLPQDLHIGFGIPDLFLTTLAAILQYGSMLLLIVAFVGKLGIPYFTFSFPAPFASFLKIGILVGVFLNHFVMIGKIKKPTTLFRQIVGNLMFFLFIATVETALIMLTNAWGYDFAPLIHAYVPSNIYQVVACHYLIFLFLFFQPSFLTKKSKRRLRILWHSLSLVPLALLVVSYVLSNSYAMIYGVEENLFVNFWFPNGFLPLSVVSVLFIYITFFLRYFHERKYGTAKAQIYFYGDRYTFHEDLICAGLILIVACIDLAFQGNQYGFYLGLGNNVWLFAIIPFVALCKFSPNNQQTLLLSDELLPLFDREAYLEQE